MASYAPYNSRALQGSTASGAVGEIVLGLAIVLVATALFFTAEGVQSSIASLNKRYVRLLDYTVNADDKSLVIHQDLSKFSEAKPVLFSENEPSGTEFAYSFFLFVNPNSTSTESALNHVWHKGYGCAWPLMGPGVFMHSDTNTLRVVMNTTESPYSFVDVTNIPVNKWFHVVLNCQKSALEIHINGNLTNKLRFENGLPYQNFQDIVLFSTTNYTLRASTCPALKGEDFLVRGSFKGLMSEFLYTRYALSFTEIQALMNAGPSNKMKTQVMDKPPYLADTWWTTQYNTA
jgi:hypothetical protein